MIYHLDVLNVMGTYLSIPRVMMHFFTYWLLSKGHQTENCLEQKKKLKDLFRDPRETNQPPLAKYSIN